MLKLDYTELNKKSVMGSQAELRIIEFYQLGFGFVKYLLICFPELRHVSAQFTVSHPFMF